MGQWSKLKDDGKNAIAVQRKILKLYPCLQLLGSTIWGTINPSGGPRAVHMTRNKSGYDHSMPCNLRLVAVMRMYIARTTGTEGRNMLTA